MRDRSWGTRDGSVHGVRADPAHRIGCSIHPAKSGVVRHSGPVGDVRELRSAASARRQDALAQTVELVLAAERSAPRQARHWIMRSIAEAGVHGVSNQVIELLAGEVVANAVLHGPADGEILVEVRIDGEAVKVSVTDESPDRPRVLHPEPTAASGRGMALVAALSTDWGIERRERGGKTVWFSVDPEAER